MSARFFLGAFASRACLVVVALAFAVPLAAVSAAAVEPAASLESSAEELGLTSEALAARLASIRDDTTLGTDVRELALSSYEAALDALKDAQAWDFKARKYARLAEEAAGHLKRLRSEEPLGVEIAGDLAKLSLAELEQRAGDLRARIAENRDEIEEVGEEQQRRAQRRVEIPTRRSELRKQLAQLQAEISANGGLDAATEPRRAGAIRAAAEERSLELESAALEAEVESYDARRELLALRRDVASREMAVLEAQQRQLQAALDAARMLDAERAAAAALGAEMATADSHPVLKAAAARNAELAAARIGPDGVVARLEKARALADRVARRSEELQKDFKAVQERAKLIGFTPSVGALLRKQKLALPTKSFHRAKIRERQEEIARAQLTLLELEDERASLADPAAAARELAAGAIEGVDPAEASRGLAALSELLERRRDYIDALLDDYDEYFLTLVDLDTKQRELLEATSAFGEYIDSHVLWIRSTTPLNTRTFRSAAEALSWIVHPANGARVLEESRQLLAVSPAGFIVAALSVAVLFAVRQRLNAYRQALEAASTAASSASLRPFLASIANALVSALRWPTAMWLLAWLLGEAAGDYTRAIASGLHAAAHGLFLGELGRQITKKDGLGIRHLGWTEQTSTTARRFITTALLGFVPAIFLVSAVHGQPNDEWKESLGRIAFIVGTSSLAVLSYRLLRRRGPIIEALLGTDAGTPTLLVRARKLLGPFLFLLCLFQVALAALGYYFAALSIAPNFLATVQLVVVVSLCQAIAIRWLALARRRHAEGTTPPLAEVAEGAMPATAVASVQDRRVLMNLSTLVIVVGLFMIWNDVLPAFNALNRVELWKVNVSETYEVTTEAGVETRTGVQQIPITLGNLLQAFIILVVGIAASRHLPGVLEISVLKRMRLEPGLANAITTIVGYLFVLVGVIAAAGRLGLAWSQVQWLAAAVTVGLGFGLQEIFANFVSGLILLFERPIRIDDTVTLGDVTGRVSRINIRATTIVDWDNKELVVPNKEFVTGQLINWTLSDPMLRVIVPVGIAYGSDTKEAERILLELAKKHPNVVDDPPPFVLFGGFGDNSLNFELRVFIPNIRYLQQTRHQLHMKIDEAFREAGIEIAFPQRDLHLRSVSAPVPVRIES